MRVSIVVGCAAAPKRHSFAQAQAMRQARSFFAVMMGTRRQIVEQLLLVTGASRGIGAATARLAAGRGYVVAVNYAVNRQAADEVVRSIQEAGGRAFAVQADVAHEDQILGM